MDNDRTHHHHRVDVYVHLPESSQGSRFDKIEALLQVLITKENKIMASIDDVLAQVSELPSINDSLDQVFAKLQELIVAGGADPAKLQQALDMIVAQKERTKAAIVANTPASGETPPSARHR